MKEVETTYTHDKYCLDENRKHDPKEYFKFVLNEVDADLANAGHILDVGCATGDFLWFLGERFPDAKLTGIDIDDEFLQKAKVEVPHAEFIYGNIVTDKFDEQYDLIFMMNVHPIYDSLEEWLDPLVKLLRKQKNAAIHVFGCFNPEEMDVLIRARPSSSNVSWETGWNLFSKKTIRDYCANKGWECDFKDFQIGIDLKKNESNPLRSYTIMTEDKDRLVVNGLQLVHKFSLLVLLPHL
jgi:trans-aconitate methyltransferase